jgi:hypothetical protein
MAPASSGYQAGRLLGPCNIRGNRHGAACSYKCIWRGSHRSCTVQDVPFQVGCVPHVTYTYCNRTGIHMRASPTWILGRSYSNTNYSSIWVADHLGIVLTHHIHAAAFGVARARRASHTVPRALSFCTLLSGYLTSPCPLARTWFLLALSLVHSTVSNLSAQRIHALHGLRLYVFCQCQMSISVPV